MIGCRIARHMVAARFSSILLGEWQFLVPMARNLPVSTHDKAAQAADNRLQLRSAFAGDKPRSSGFDGEFSFLPDLEYLGSPGL